MSAVAVAGLIILGVIVFIIVGYAYVKYWVDKKLGEWS